MPALQTRPTEIEAGAASEGRENTTTTGPQAQRLPSSKRDPCLCQQPGVVYHGPEGACSRARIRTGWHSVGIEGVHRLHQSGFTKHSDTVVPHG